MFSYGSARHALGRPQDRLAAACSRASHGLQGAACPPGWAELIFCLHSVACLSSLGPTILFSLFSAFPDVDAKVCVCVCFINSLSYSVRKEILYKCVCVCHQFTVQRLIEKKSIEESGLIVKRVCANRSWKDCDFG